MRELCHAFSPGPDKRRVCMAVVGSLQRLAAPLFLPAGRRLCSSSAGRDVYDLVVVGGGMVGSALACSVGKLSIGVISFTVISWPSSFSSGREPSFSHKRVLLLESNPSPPQPVTADDAYSNRVSTLSLGSVDLMKSMHILIRTCGQPHPQTPLQLFNHIMYEKHNIWNLSLIPRPHGTWGWG